MFGSNFDANFGIPTFPQAIDAQGGYLGPNAAPDPMASQNAAVTTPVAPIGAPTGGLPATPAAPALGSPSPLAGGPLSPGGPQTQPAAPEAGIAPAAGIGSPFGRPPNG